MGIIVDGLLNVFRTIGAGRLILMAAVVAGLVGFFFFVTMRLSAPQMGLLYGDLDLTESSSIIERLNGMNVPYELRNDGRSIMVPSDRIADIRVTLAGEGLGGSLVGWEIFDRSDGLGSTSFVQNINRLRATEGELARTIQEINAITSARVHIVMPERELFRTDAPDPSASIVLKTARGGLSTNQVMAIQHMVAAAVPGLDAQNISIVDQRGTLLARGGQSNEEAFFASTLEDRRVALEDRLKSDIESLLERTIGAGRVRAEVSLEIDKNRVTTSRETYDPDGQVVRSSNTIEEISEETEEGQQAVSVEANLPEEEQTVSSGPASTRTRTDETVNFEISKTVTTEVNEGGAIERMSVAVLVDGVYEANADGQDVYRPRTEEELERIETLVRSAVGFDAARGDILEVVNMQFAQIEEPPALPPEFSFFGFSKEDLAWMLEILIFGVVSILVLLLVVRPLVMKLIAAIPEPAPRPAGQIRDQRPDYDAIQGPDQEESYEVEENEDEDDQIRKLAQSGKPLKIDAQIDVASVEGRVKESALKKVGDIVSRHPEESAAIVRQWLYSD